MNDGGLRPVAPPADARAAEAPKGSELVFKPAAAAPPPPECECEYDSRNARPLSGLIISISPVYGAEERWRLLRPSPPPPRMAPGAER